MMPISLYILQQKKKWTVDARNPERAGSGSKDQSKVESVDTSPQPAPRPFQAEMVAKIVVTHSTKNTIQTREDSSGERRSIKEALTEDFHPNRIGRKKGDI